MKINVKFAVLLTTMLAGTAFAKCNTYGYQTICDNAREYDSAPAPAAANQNYFARPQTGRVMNNKGNGGSNYNGDCGDLEFAEALRCKAQENARQEQEYRANGGVITKCVQVGNTTKCYTR
jgi:hypothetical protein